MGVRLQRLDKGDRLSEVVLVPPEAEDDAADDDTSNDTEASDTETINPESSAQDS
jgi:DNA gyrase subunit A